MHNVEDFLSKEFSGDPTFFIGSNGTLRTGFHEPYADIGTLESLVVSKEGIQLDFQKAQCLVVGKEVEKAMRGLGLLAMSLPRMRVRFTEDPEKDLKLISEKITHSVLFLMFTGDKRCPGVHGGNSVAYSYNKICKSLLGWDSPVEDFSVVVSPPVDHPSNEVLKLQEIRDELTGIGMSLSNVQTKLGSMEHMADDISQYLSHMRQSW